jgi:alpha-ketoglutarate-dependent taurine dioxygenase
MKGVRTSKITSTDLPLVIEPEGSQPKKEDFLAYLSENSDDLKQSIQRHGGLLFRGFPIANAADFSQVIKHLKTGNFIDYIGGDSPRKKIIDGVYTSTEAPPSVKISLHNELSFVRDYPAHIYFFCETAPKERGETIIGDARSILKAIDPAVRERFSRKGLLYTSHYHYKSQFMQVVNRFHKSWIDVFETESKAEVERLCHANDFQFEWHRNDWLKMQQRCPAVISHKQTNEDVWFNQAHLFDFNPKFLGWLNYLGTKVLYSRANTKLHEVAYGDGSPIDQKDLYHIMDVLDAQTLRFPWREGDVLVLDNVLSMHGRATFKGKRRILTAMTG